MCRSKEEGGRRCEGHSPANRRAGRAATRIFGTNDANARQALGLLDSEFVHGNIKQRALVAKYAKDPAIIALAARDPKAAVRDALDENRHEALKNAALSSEMKKNWDPENLASELVNRERLSKERKDEEDRERLKKEKDLRAAKSREYRQRKKDEEALWIRRDNEWHESWVASLQPGQRQDGGTDPLNESKATQQKETTQRHADAGRRLRAAVEKQRHQRTPQKLHEVKNWSTPLSQRDTTK